MKKIFIPVLMIIVLALSGMFIWLNFFKQTVPSEYQNYYVIDQFQLGGKSRSETESAMNKLGKIVYDWYLKIENQPGVYLFNSEFYTSDMIEAALQDNPIAKTLKPFWYFTVSPNYLEDIMKIKIDKNLISEVNAGTRVYLIPTNGSEADQKVLKQLLTDHANYGLDHPTYVQSQFMKKPQVMFATYKSDADFYNWKEKKEFVKNPIIYICTGQNMRYFEGESLAANLNFGDGYLKFKDKSILEEALKQADNKTFEEFSLKFSAAKDFHK